MLATALALTASLLWGLADFLGGVQSRRLDALLVVMVSQFAGLAGVATVALAFGVEAPGWGVLGPGLIAGLGTAVGLGGLYRGLAVGTMSVVAPIAALSVAVPVLAGAAAGERPSFLQWSGMAVASAGVIVARATGPQSAARAAATRAGLAFGLLAALGLGVALVGLDAGAPVSVLWTVLVTRGVAGLALLAWRRAAGAELRPRAADLPIPALVGLLETFALGLLAWATTTGLLGVVAVLGSLYPLATVGLAQVMLGERLRVPQALGGGTALVGVALLAAGR